MTITRMDKKIVTVLGQGVERALKELADGDGLTVKYAGGSYSDVECTLKFTFRVITTANGLSGRQKEWNDHARMLGMDPADFGSLVTTKNGNKVYRIVGCMPNRSAYPIIGETVPGGKEYLLRASNIVKLPA